VCRVPTKHQGLLLPIFATPAPSCLCHSFPHDPGIPDLHQSEVLLSISSKHQWHAFIGLQRSRCDHRSSTSSGCFRDADVNRLQQHIYRSIHDGVLPLCTQLVAAAVSSEACCSFVTLEYHMAAEASFLAGGRSALVSCCSISLRLADIDLVSKA